MRQIESLLPPFISVAENLQTENIVKIYLDNPVLCSVTVSSRDHDLKWLVFYCTPQLYWDPCIVLLSTIKLVYVIWTRLQCIQSKSGSLKVAYLRNLELLSDHFWCWFVQKSTTVHLKKVVSLEAKLLSNWELLSSV